MKTYTHSKRSTILIIVLIVLAVIAFVQYKKYKGALNNNVSENTSSEVDPGDTNIGTHYAPATAPICKITAKNKVYIYNKPNVTASVFGSLSKGQVQGITGISGNGWFVFDQTGSTGVLRHRYVAPDGAFTQSGKCTNLIKIPTAL